MTLFLSFIVVNDFSRVLLDLRELFHRYVLDPSCTYIATYIAFRNCKKYHLSLSSSFGRLGVPDLDSIREMRRASEPFPVGLERSVKVHEARSVAMDLLLRVSISSLERFLTAILRRISCVDLLMTSYSLCFVFFAGERRLSQCRQVDATPRVVVQRILRNQRRHDQFGDRQGSDQNPA